MESALRPPPDPGFRLIETCLWTPEGGLHREGFHLNRLYRSADRLGIVPGDVKAAIGAVKAEAPKRLRLTVDVAGNVEITLHPFAPEPEGKVWRLAVSETRLMPGDPWLSVKSTERALYDTTRATLPEGVDEMLFLNTAGEVCEGTITNVFADLGEGLLTPALSSGVLPGVLRESLIAGGKAREAALSLNDLLVAKAIYVGNALRGLIRAEMI